MKCVRCERANPPSSKFCLECGAPLDVRCSACAARLPPDAKFCNECGHRVAALAPTAAPRFASPDAYTPKHLAELIVTSKGALEGERKLVTVLFADLKGSTELLVDRDPEEARAVLDPVLQLMIDAVHRYEGTVNQVMGDGIMALFGAPIAHEDHALRACYAALSMHEAVRRGAGNSGPTPAPPIQIRVGVNSGEVVVRAIGSDLHMDYTAVGHTTHLAARMEQLAVPGTTLLAPDTIALVDGLVEVEALGPMTVKGFARPMRVHELRGVSAVRSRLRATAARRGLSAFVGRDAEMDQLRDARTLVENGRGQVCAIVGEPGIGKSRLLWQFTQAIGSQEWRIVSASCVSYGSGTAFLTAQDLVRDYFDAEPGAGGSDLRERVVQRLAGLDASLAAIVTPLLWVLDPSVSDDHWQRLDPLRRRRLAVDAVTRAFLRESQRRPLLLVLEDLHWIDEHTQAVLDSLVESLPGTRTLLLVSYRPEYRHSWAGKTYYRHLRIDPLPEARVEDLLAELLGSDQRLAPLTAELVRRAEGNPFFLEESVHSLAETGVLAGGRGAYRLGHSAAEAAMDLPIPASTHAMLAGRIDRLMPETKRILQAAAVIGKDISYPLLRAIADVSEIELQKALTTLRSAEFLYETRLFPEVEYTFKHALTHEVAYAGLLTQRRRELHARIVEAVEAQGDASPSHHQTAERLAHHALRGERWEKVVRYSRQAALEALARSSHRQAATLFQQALRALQHLPETRVALEMAIDMRGELRNALWLSASYEAVLVHMLEAERLAEAIGDQRRFGRVSAQVAMSLMGFGRIDEARVRAERARAIGSMIGDDSVALLGSFNLGVAAVLAGDYGEAVRLHLGVKAAMPRFDPAAFAGNLTVLSGSWLAIAYGQLGEFGAGTAHGEEALRLAEIAQHPFSLVFVLIHLAGLHRIRGDLEVCIALGNRALALSEEWELNLTWAADWHLGHAYSLSGRDEGRALLDRALRAFASVGWGWGVWIEAQLGEAHLLSGEPGLARAAVEHALEAARQHGERGHEAWALNVLGAIAETAPRSRDEAERCYRASLLLATDLGMRPVAAHCHAGLARVNRQAGRPDQAAEQLAIAAAMYSEMGMRHWLQKLSGGD